MAEDAPKPSRSQIADYGLIGDCETAALVDRNGSIDWLCWPRFDSDACFAALLGDEDNGAWKIAPAGEFTTSRQYRDGTLILETVFETADGAVALIDFMPPRGDESSHIVRIVEGRRGRVSMQMNLVLRFGYGLTVPWVSRLEDGGLRAIAGPSMAVLHTPVHTRGEHMRTIAEFEVGEGEQIPFVLSHSASHLPLPELFEAKEALAATEAFWRGWLSKSRVEGEHAEAGPSVPDHAQGDDLRSHRRRGGGAHHLAARTVRRRAELGLPVLLDQGFDPDPAVDDEQRLLRRGPGLAGLAAAGGSWRSGGHADHVRHWWRATADRMDRGLAARTRAVQAGQDRQRRARSSSSWMSMAS